MALNSFLQKVSKYIRGKLNEREFEKNVNLILKDNSFDRQNNIMHFEYEGKNIQMQVPDIRDHISYEIARQKKFFSYTNLEDIRQFIPQNAVIVDAGANIGNHSLFFARVCAAAEIHSFEPQEDVFRILERNIFLNNCKGIIIPYKLALGDKVGHASIDFREDLDISSSKKMLNLGGVFIKEDDTGSFRLDTLDNILFAKLRRLDFMKIDVQGFEVRFLKGAFRIITQFKPLMYLEVTTQEELNSKILPIMDELGYKIKRVYTIDYLFEPYK